MFVLNTNRDLDYVPLVGDIIKTTNKDFQKATFRVKPFSGDKNYRIIRNNVVIDFHIISRKFDLKLNEWELICEPTPDSLLFLLKEIKVK